MQGAGQVDLCIHHQLQKKLTEEQRADLLLIQSGAIWTASAMHRAGYLETPLCPWCQKATEDLAHLFWECEHHEHCRGPVREKGIDWAKLPKALALHGIPVEPAAKLDAGLWRHQDCQEPAEDRPCDMQGDDRVSWACVHEEITETIARQRGTRTIESMTTRQLGEWIQGDFSELPAWEIGDVHGPAQVK